MHDSRLVESVGTELVNFDDHGACVCAKSLQSMVTVKLQVDFQLQRVDVPDPRVFHGSTVGVFNFFLMIKKM